LEHDETMDAAAREDALSRAQDAHALASHQLIDAWLAVHGWSLEELDRCAAEAAERFVEARDRVERGPWPGAGGLLTD